jgi:hypothetical protein
LRRRFSTIECRLGTVGLALVALAFVFARTGIPWWIPSAPSARIGIPSPLTGMTRSFVAVARGDFWLAFRMHPLGPMTFACCLVLAINGLYALLKGRALAWPQRAARQKAVWLVVSTAFAVVWFAQLIR